MEGFTPWELSTFKLIYHRHDAGRKGFLDFSDFQSLCRNFGVVNLTEEQFLALYQALDLDGDSHLSFEEVLKFLSHSSDACTVSENTLTLEHQQELLGAMKLRAAMLSNKACIAAGAAMGVIPMLKSKIAILLGTLFYDPIRLYRSFYVEYCTTLRSVFAVDSMLWKQQAAASSANVARGAAAAAGTPNFTLFEIMNKMSLFQLFAAHVRLTKNILATIGWFVYSFSLDTSVGIGMFLSYAATRRWLMNSHREFCKEHPCQAEFISGSVAGCVTGILQGPARFLAKQPRNILSGLRHLRKNVFPRVEEAIFRQTFAHGSFFTAFYAAQKHLREYLYHQKKWVEKNSLHEAMLTSASGCCAGGVYRFVSVPMARGYEYVKHHGFHRLARQRFTSKYRILTKGLGESLLWTMPTTGVAFLVYEAAFIYL